LLVANLVFAVLMFVTTILFVLKKWNVVNILSNIVKMHPN
jgi:hypothetical protein